MFVLDHIVRVLDDVFGETAILGYATSMEVLTKNWLSTPAVKTVIALQ